ncbi:MAG: hypothetical protein M0R06_03130 [Sphaerochaeta sp.]|jgi:hypothetical protein|nr:hypothetical protein [Sphaerochaeta sp.]
MRDGRKVLADIMDEWEAAFKRWLHRESDNLQHSIDCARITDQLQDLMGVLCDNHQEFSDMVTVVEQPGKGETKNMLLENSGQVVSVTDPNEVGSPGR